MSASSDLRQRPLDLKRHLIIRVILFALAVLFVGTAVALIETRYRVRGEIQRTGHTIRQLITDEIHRSGNAYSRTFDESNLDLNSLSPIGSLIHFCVRLTDLYSHPVSEHCFDRPIELPGPLESIMRQVIGADAIYQGSIGQYPGITIGQLTVTPNYGNELITLCQNLINLLAVSLTILLMSFLIYRPVRNALAPSAAMLETLKCMEDGDLQARMPTFTLIELDRIGQGFNHLAERLQQTIRTQQRLARHLLSAREEERLHLSRELHDEFGQYLTSLNAEASFALELADESVPALRPCAESISRTASHMMEVLQQILYRLRPVGLDEFGLSASLQQLVEHWKHRNRSTHFQLSIDESLDHLPDNVAVSLYRIVQESITNTIKHGQGSHLEIVLQKSGEIIHLQVRDDGRGGVSPAFKEESRKSGGFGLLGMEERVLALGGTLRIQPLPPSGTVIDVRLPLQEPTGDLS